MTNAKNKEIKIAFVDFWKDFEETKNPFFSILDKHFKVSIDKQNPDFVFCSHFGSEYLNYKCPRILYLGEAKAPDFNIYDYAIAFDDIKFGDRYLQYPYVLFHRDNLNAALHKHELSEFDYLSRDKFCNVVVSNNLCDKKRDVFFKGLSKYKKVDSGGKHLNNLPDGKPVKDKLAFQKEYKYSFAFENSSFKDYVTEKIVDAWAAGTIPIYWGAPNIGEYFNPKAFINCNNMDSPSELISVIEEIENDKEKYLAIMQEPILSPNSKMIDMLKDDYLENFLLNIFNQEPSEALRRNSAFTMWGWNYEHHILRWSQLESKWWFKKAKNILKHK